MAEAVQIAVAPGSIPPLPPGAVSNEGRIPPATHQQPGYVANTVNPADAFLQPAAAPTPPGMSAAELAEFAEFKAFKAAQAAAPVAPPAQAPVSATAALDLAVSASRHDPILESMLGIFDGAAQGLDRNRAIGNALTRGDATLVDTAYLREVGGANAERLITLAQGIVTHCNESTNRAAASVYNIAGGEANWAAATAAFNRGAPDHLKQFVQHALNSGSHSQIEAGAKSVVEFAKSSGLVSVPGSGHVQPSAGAPGSAQGLSKEDFQAAHAALDKNDRQYERRKGELYGHRQIGKQLGL